MAVTVTMPQLGETVTEGTILAWAKQVGDTIAEDEVLLEISTDKVDTEVPSPAAGVIREILIAEGETVGVGTPLAVIGDVDEEQVSTAAGESDAVSHDAAAEDAAPEDSAADDATGDVAEETPAPVSEAVVAAAPPAAASTSDAPRRGVLSPVVRRLAAEHEIDIGLVPGTGEGGRITRKDVTEYLEKRAPVAFVEELVPAAPPPPPVASSTGETATELPAEAAMQASDATEPETKVTFEPASSLGGPGDQVVELTRLRRRIADNMTNARRSAAHVWASVEVDYEPVERVRQTHREAFKAREGFSLTYLPFVARATVDALAMYPVVNSSLHLDEGSQVFHAGVGLGIAVDVDQKGLVVVTVPGADGLRLKGLARQIRAKADKAREGRLEPDDVAGSTFTITNAGPYGSYMTAPIINVPNVGILSTDSVTKRPTVITLPDGSDTIAIHHIGYLGLSWDHRAFDGSTAVMFLNRIKENLETWDWEQELL
ncbi:MAG: dihydrolipoamide acetyltransferase family protein [Acidimicrobiia bacterium]